MNDIHSDDVANLLSREALLWVGQQIKYQYFCTKWNLTVKNSLKDEDLFKKKLHQENAEELFKKNKRLIDFQEIPQDLIDDYRVKNKDIISMIV